MARTVVTHDAGAYDDAGTPLDIPTGGQAAIADVSGTALVLLADVISVLGEMRTKLNTLLAELRTAGIIDT